MFFMKWWGCSLLLGMWVNMLMVSVMVLLLFLFGVGNVCM